MPQFRDVRALARLTERERQIMQLVCEGLSNKEVARRLGVSDGTVKVHRHHIYEKLAGLLLEVLGRMWQVADPTATG